MRVRLLDKIFRSATGEIVIVQMPNLPILIWIVATILKIFFKTGKTNLGLDILATVALLIWAIQELFQGVNYFRRGLGLIVLIWLIGSKI
jgi:uncharacterized membrane protein YGL010W